MAAQRLKSIGDFFNPLAFDFIGKYLQQPVETALDLGCGPGYTTKMLANVTHSKNVYGCDLSDEFLASARAANPQCHFIKHDVTQTPFPVKPGIIYARFILAHLKNIGNLLSRWVDALDEGGILFVEETEEIYTKNPLFKKYLEINEGLVATQGATLFAGRQMRGCVDKHNVLVNEAVELPVSNWQAAGWFYPNTVTIWQTEPYVQSRITDEERIAIAAAFRDLIDRRVMQSDITWQMRRMVIRKAC